MLKIVSTVKMRNENAENMEYAFGILIDVKAFQIYYIEEFVVKMKRVTLQQQEIWQKAYLKILASSVHFCSKSLESYLPKQDNHFRK